VRRIALAILLLLVAARAARAEQVVLSTAELKKERAHRRSVRNVGYVLIGGAVALGAGAGMSRALGARAGDSIAFGGFETAADIEARAAEARRYDQASRWLAGAGAVLAGTGLVLVLTHPNPRAPRIEAAPVAGGAVVGVSGVLP
jgi:hypothetical protein